MKKSFKVVLLGLILTLSSFVKGQVNCTSTLAAPCDFKVQQNFVGSDNKQIYNAIRSLATSTSSSGSGSVVVTNTVNFQDNNLDSLNKHLTRIQNRIYFDNLYESVFIEDISGGYASTADLLYRLKQKNDSIVQDLRYQVNVLKAINTTAYLFSSGVVNSSGSISGGARSVTFITSADFTGSINGVTRNGNFSYSVTAPPPAGVLPNIPYAITTGSIIIDQIR